MRSFQRPHYAWLICFGTALNLFVVYGLGVNVLSVYLPDLILQRGFTNTQASLLPTIRNLVSLFSMFPIISLCSRFGPRKLIAAGNVLTVACYLGFALFDSFFACSLCCALLGVAYALSGSTPVAFVLSKWFESRRSFAMGLSTSTSGLALLVAPPIVTRLIAAFGLTTTFLFHSTLCLLLAAIAVLVLRNTPDEISKTPYRGSEREKKSASVARAEPLPHLTHLHTGAFLLVSVLIGGPVGVGYTHVAVLLRTEGYPEMLAAGAVSLMGLTLMLAKILCADIYDRIGGWRGNFLVFGLCTAGLFLLTQSASGSIPLVYLAIILFGLGIASGSVSTYQWSSDLYGTQGFAAGVRSFNVAYTMGSLLFGPLPGMLADRFGSYIPAFSLFLAIYLVAFLLLQFLYHHLGLHKA